MSIAVHVFGGCKGESIAIAFPDGSWGVVDCHTHSSSELRKNPVAKFLKSNGVSSLDFLCLTHSHDDHFSGLQQLIDNFSVEQFWHFDAMSIDRLRQFLKSSIKRDQQNQKATGKQPNARQLAELWSSVSKLQKAGGLTVQRLGLGHSCIADEDDRGFTIDSIGPSDRQATRFERMLEAHLLDPAKYPNHRSANLCSTGLLITYGKTRILLGGDTEEGGWRDLVDQRSYMAGSLNYVKIAHHGSANGYCDGLWELHTKNTPQTIKVVTPYKRFDLPQKATIDHLEKNGGFVFSAGDPYLDHQFASTFVTALSELKSDPVNRNEFSRVSFTFDDQGVVIGSNLEGDAIRIC